MPGDQLDPDRLRAEVLRPDGRWRRLDVVAETGSTNADLAAGFRRGEAASGTVLSTDHQSAGRGRQGRTWTAPPGSSIALSVLITPERTDGWTWLPLLAGLSVADALRAVADVPTTLKWPNDVLVDDAKICGVLAERVVAGSAVACVLGMGVNVHLGRADLPVPTATSLALLRPDVDHDRNDLIATILALLELWLGRWETGTDDDVIRAAYRERCGTLGRQVEVQLAGAGPVRGRAAGIDPDGRLIVETPTGDQVFGAGDVAHLR